jgi:2-phosphosulfolactate phosphatase
MHVDLYLTPLAFTKANLDGRTIVVIDVLRFCTTTCAALQAGARGVIPTDGPGEAGEMRLKIGADMTVVAGERDGIKLESFNFGNSPTEFTRESVGGKYVVMTTTNGTGILSKSYKSDAVIAGALVNMTKVADRVARANRDVVVVCSGQEGGFSIEDTICGGMLIHLLNTVHQKQVTVNDAGSLALLLYRTNKTAIRQTLEQGEHGRFLTSIGFGGDVAIASDVDSIPVVPVLRDGRLVLDEN